MKLSKKQSGFAVLELVAVLVVVLGLLGIGYYVYQANNKTTNTYDAAGDSASAVVPQTDESTLIKAAVKNYKDNTGVADSDIYICHQNATYALGGAGGALWFAQKKDGSWKVVSQGMNGHSDELKAAGLSAWDGDCSAPAGSTTHN